MTGGDKEGKPDRGLGNRRNFDLFSCEAVEKRKSEMIVSCMWPVS